MSTIADRLGILAAEHGGLQALADAAVKRGYEITKQGVHGYVTGKSEKIPGDFLAALCRELEVSPWWLLLDVGHPDDPPPDTDAYAKGRADAAKILDDAREKMAPASLFRVVPDPDRGASIPPEGRRAGRGD